MYLGSKDFTEYIIKENIFKLPLNLYSGVIKNLYFNDTKKTMDFDTIAVNRNDFEWMKDLRQKIGQGKQMTFQWFNGDLISIHKSNYIKNIVIGLLSVFKTEFDEDEDTIDENESVYFKNIELISQYSKWLIQCSLSTPKIWSIKLMLTFFLMICCILHLYFLFSASFFLSYGHLEK